MSPSPAKRRKLSPEPNTDSGAGRSASQTSSTPAPTSSQVAQRSVRGGMASAPRRMSRSPQVGVGAGASAAKVSRAGESIARGGADTGLDAVENPFARRGLRRSPIAPVVEPVVQGRERQKEGVAEEEEEEELTERATQDTPVQMQPEVREEINPFKKSGLRRSFTEVTAEGSPMPAREPPRQPARESTSEPQRKEPTPEPTRVTAIEPAKDSQAEAEEEPEVDPPRKEAIEPAQDREPEVSQGRTEEQAPKSPVEEPMAPGRQPAKEPRRLPRAAQPSRSTEPESEEDLTEAPATSRSAKAAQREQQEESEELEEPELPPTPIQRGIADPIVTTPPTGIHNTPSKRRRPLQSSPLKPKDANPRPSQPSTSSQTSEKAAEEPPARKRHPEEPTSRIIHVDPNAAKNRERERLLAEIRQLEADVKLAEQENERVRKAQVAGKPVKPAPNADAIINLLARVVGAPPEMDEPKKKGSMLGNINLFLPFSRRRARRQGQTPAAAADVVLKEEDLPSVLPIDVPDPEKYLRAFTSLTFSSTIVSLPPSSSDPNADILHQHTITTTGPAALFNSKIAVTVNTTSLSITDIQLLYLDPLAADELGPFFRARAGPGVLGRDINAIFYSQNRWFEAALSRARFWCDVMAQLGTEEDRLRQKKRIKAAIRRRKGIEAREGEEVVGEEPKRTWTMGELGGEMGRRRWEVDVEGVGLVFEWRVRVDWAGECENVVRARGRVPRALREADERKGLSKIPEVFAGLVKLKDPLTAARTLVVELMR